MSTSDSPQDTAVLLWERWPTGDRPPFHRYCDLVPVTVEDGTLTWDWLRDEDSPVELLPPAIRAVLRYTPLLVALGVGLTVLATPTAIPAVSTSVLQTTVSWPTVLLVALFAVWLVALLTLVRLTIDRSRSGLGQAVVIYGLLGGLAVGVGAVLVATVNARHADPMTQLPTFAVDLWLLLLLGGMLVYDGTLRAENMFGHLTRKQPGILDETGGEYEDTFRARLEARLTKTVALGWPRGTGGGRSVRVAYLFGVVFVAPFTTIWLRDAVMATSGGQAMPALGVARVALMTAGSFVIVVVAYQFLLLVVTFDELLTEHAPDAADEEAFHLTYDPFHPDERGGFGDFGYFAMRVNTLLLLGGLYHAVRVYVYGIPLLAEVQTTTALVVWGFNHLAPFVFYLGFVVYWLYLSLWKVHKVMRRGRELELQARTATSDGVPDTSLAELRAAPVWPVNVRKIYAMLSADIIPFIGLLPFVPI